jgi:hypothetical protein
MKREQTLIQIELKNIQNKKKLANYNRWKSWKLKGLEIIAIFLCRI